jgi:hypothetical protein
METELKNTTEVVSFEFSQETEDNILSNRNFIDFWSSVAKNLEKITGFFPGSHPDLIRTKLVFREVDPELDTEIGESIAVWSPSEGVIKINSDFSEFYQNAFQNHPLVFEFFEAIGDAALHYQREDALEAESKSETFLSLELGVGLKRFIGTYSLYFTSSYCSSCFSKKTFTLDEMLTRELTRCYRKRRLSLRGDSFIDADLEEDGDPDVLYGFLLELFYGKFHQVENLCKTGYKTLLNKSNEVTRNTEQEYSDFMVVLSNLFELDISSLLATWGFTNFDYAMEVPADYPNPFDSAPIVVSEYMKQFVDPMVTDREEEAVDIPRLILGSSDALGLGSNDSTVLVLVDEPPEDNESFSGKLAYILGSSLEPNGFNNYISVPFDLGDICDTPVTLLIPRGTVEEFDLGQYLHQVDKYEDDTLIFCNVVHLGKEIVNKTAKVIEDGDDSTDENPTFKLSEIETEITTFAIIAYNDYNETYSYIGDKYAQVVTLEEIPKNIFFNPVTNQNQAIPGGVETIIKVMTSGIDEFGFIDRTFSSHSQIRTADDVIIGEVNSELEVAKDIKIALFSERPSPKFVGAFDVFEDMNHQIDQAKAATVTSNVIGMYGKDMKLETEDIGLQLKNTGELSKKINALHSARTQQEQRKNRAITLNPQHVKTYKLAVKAANAELFEQTKNLLNFKALLNLYNSLSPDEQKSIQSINTRYPIIISNFTSEDTLVNLYTLERMLATDALYAVSTINNPVPTSSLSTEMLTGIARAIYNIISDKRASEINQQVVDTDEIRNIDPPSITDSSSAQNPIQPPQVVNPSIDPKSVFDPVSPSFVLTNTPKNYIPAGSATAIEPPGVAAPPNASVSDKPRSALSMLSDLIVNGPAGVAGAVNDPKNPMSYLNGSFLDNAVSAVKSGVFGMDGFVPVFNPQANPRASASLLGAVAAAAATAMGADAGMAVTLQDALRKAVGDTFVKDGKAAAQIWDTFIKDTLPQVTGSVFKDDPVVQAAVSKVYNDYISPAILSSLEKNETKPVNDAKDAANLESKPGLDNSATPASSPQTNAAAVQPSTATRPLNEFIYNKPAVFKALDIKVEFNPNAIPKERIPDEISGLGFIFNNANGANVPLFDTNQVGEMSYASEAESVDDLPYVFKSLLANATDIKVAQKNPDQIQMQTQKTVDELKKLGVKDAAIQNYKSSKNLENYLDSITSESLLSYLGASGANDQFKGINDFISKKLDSKVVSYTHKVEQKIEFLLPDFKGVIKDLDINAAVATVSENEVHLRVSKEQLYLLSTGKELKLSIPYEVQRHKYIYDKNPYASMFIASVPYDEIGNVLPSVTPNTSGEYTYIEDFQINIKNRTFFVNGQLGKDKPSTVPGDTTLQDVLLVNSEKSIKIQDVFRDVPGPVEPKFYYLDMVIKPTPGGGVKIFDPNKSTSDLSYVVFKISLKSEYREVSDKLDKNGDYSSNVIVTKFSSSSGPNFISFGLNEDIYYADDQQITVPVYNSNPRSKIYTSVFKGDVDNVVSGKVKHLSFKSNNLASPNKGSYSGVNKNRFLYGSVQVSLSSLTNFYIRPKIAIVDYIGNTSKTYIVSDSVISAFGLNTQTQAKEALEVDPVKGIEVPAGFVGRLNTNKVISFEFNTFKLNNDHGNFDVEINFELEDFTLDNDFYKKTLAERQASFVSPDQISDFFLNQKTDSVLSSILESANKLNSAISYFELKEVGLKPLQMWYSDYKIETEAAADFQTFDLATKKKDVNVVIDNSGKTLDIHTEGFNENIQGKDGLELRARLFEIPATVTPDNKIIFSEAGEEANYTVEFSLDKGKSYSDFNLCVYYTNGTNDFEILSGIINGGMNTRNPVQSRSLKVSSNTNLKENVLGDGPYKFYLGFKTGLDKDAILSIHSISLIKTVNSKEEKTKLGTSSYILASDNPTEVANLKLEDVLQAQLFGYTNTVSGKPLPKLPKLPLRVVNAYERLLDRTNFIVGRNSKNYKQLISKIKEYRDGTNLSVKKNYTSTLILDPEFTIKSGGTTYNFEMMPAVRSASPSQGMQAPGADHGVVFRTNLNIAKINIPGSTPVYQAMGVSDEVIEFVGSFLGEYQPGYTTGQAQGAKGAKFVRDPFNDYRNKDPYDGTTYQYFRAYQESIIIRKLQTAGNICTLTLRSQGQAPVESPEYPEDGINIKVNGFIISFERFIQRDDRVWYKIVFRVTDHKFDDKYKISGLNSEKAPSGKEPSTKVAQASKGKSGSGAAGSGESKKEKSGKKAAGTTTKKRKKPAPARPAARRPGRAVPSNGNPQGKVEKAAQAAGRTASAKSYPGVYEQLRDPKYFPENNRVVTAFINMLKTSTGIPGLSTLVSTSNKTSYPHLPKIIFKPHTNKDGSIDLRYGKFYYSLSYNDSDRRDDLTFTEVVPTRKDLEWFLTAYLSDRSNFSPDRYDVSRPSSSSTKLTMKSDRISAKEGPYLGTIFERYARGTPETPNAFYLYKSASRYVSSERSGTQENYYGTTTVNLKGTINIKTIKHEEKHTENNWQFSYFNSPKTKNYLSLYEEVGLLIDAVTYMLEVLDGDFVVGSTTGNLPKDTLFTPKSGGGGSATSASSGSSSSSSKSRPTTNYRTSQSWAVQLATKSYGSEKDVNALVKKIKLAPDIPNFKPWHLLVTFNKVKDNFNFKAPVFYYYTKTNSETGEKEILENEVIPSENNLQEFLNYLLSVYNPDSNIQDSRFITDNYLNNTGKVFFGAVSITEYPHGLFQLAQRPIRYFETAFLEISKAHQAIYFNTPPGPYRSSRDDVKDLSKVTSTHTTKSKFELVKANSRYTIPERNMTVPAVGTKSISIIDEIKILIASMEYFVNKLSKTVLPADIDLELPQFREPAEKVRPAAPLSKSRKKMLDAAEFDVESNKFYYNGITGRFQLVLTEADARYLKDRLENPSRKQRKVDEIRFDEKGNLAGNDKRLLTKAEYTAVEKAYSGIYSAKTAVEFAETMDDAVYAYLSSFTEMKYTMDDAKTLTYYIADAYNKAFGSNETARLMVPLQTFLAMLAHESIGLNPYILANDGQGYTNDQKLVWNSSTSSFNTGASGISQVLLNTHSQLALSVAVADELDHEAYTNYYKLLNHPLTNKPSKIPRPVKYYTILSAKILYNIITNNYSTSDLKLIDLVNQKKADPVQAGLIAVRGYHSQISGALEAALSQGTKLEYRQFSVEADKRAVNQLGTTSGNENINYIPNILKELQ